MNKYFCPLPDFLCVYSGSLCLICILSKDLNLQWDKCAIIEEIRQVAQKRDLPQSQNIVSLPLYCSNELSIIAHSDTVTWCTILLILIGLILFLYLFLLGLYNNQMCPFWLAGLLTLNPVLLLSGEQVATSLVFFPACEAHSAVFSCVWQRNRDPEISTVVQTLFNIIQTQH